MQRYFNRQEVYVRDIQIEDSPYGPRQKAEISFEHEGVYWTGLHSGKPSEGLQKGWNTVRFETVKVIAEPTPHSHAAASTAANGFTGESGVVQVKALRALDTLWNV